VQSISRSNSLLGFATVVFAAASYLSIRYVLSYDDSESWPTVTGTVISSKVVERSSSEGPWYQPQVQFEYVVDGRRYTAVDIPIFGTGVDLDHPSGSQRIVDQYPSGRELTVRYNPRRPMQALIPMGTSSPATDLPLTTGCLSSVGLVACLIAWLRKMFLALQRRAVGST
jgi:hypothetical protein